MAPSSLRVQMDVQCPRTHNGILRCRVYYLLPRKMEKRGYYKEPLFIELGIDDKIGERK